MLIRHTLQRGPVQGRSQDVSMDRYDPVPVAAPAAATPSDDQIHDHLLAAIVDTQLRF